MVIKYFDLCYRISGDFQHDMKEIMTIGYYNPLIDDLSYVEMYEIMRQPVITLAELNPATRKKPELRLEILVCSCFRGRWFLYLFSDKNWKSYYVNF
jgi:hypothetical protein